MKVENMKPFTPSLVTSFLCEVGIVDQFYKILNSCAYCMVV